ncbi:MAG: hypothetical protein JWQ07_1236 [Ramlibacter sp.]|nr:hypothetical protein [Ramlibacter sp.]
MTDDEVLCYVKAAAAALELPLDVAAAQRVAVHLARTAMLARELDAAGMDVEDEPAEVYKPAPFPAPGAAQ